MSRPYRLAFVVREYTDSEGKTKKVWGRCGTAWINKNDDDSVRNVSIKFDFYPVPIMEVVAFPPGDNDGDGERAPF